MTDVSIAFNTAVKVADELSPRAAKLEARNLAFHYGDFAALRATMVRAGMV